MKNTQQPEEGLAILKYLGLSQDLTEFEINSFRRNWERIRQYSGDCLSATKKVYTISLPNELYLNLANNCDAEPTLSRKMKEKNKSAYLDIASNLSRARAKEFDERVSKTGLQEQLTGENNVQLIISSLPTHRFEILLEDTWARYGGPSLLVMNKLPFFDKLYKPKELEKTNG